MLFVVVAGTIGKEKEKAKYKQNREIGKEKRTKKERLPRKKGVRKIKKSKNYLQHT
jgi:hypothetical protein